MTRSKQHDEAGPAAVTENYDGEKRCKKAMILRIAALDTHESMHDASMRRYLQHRVAPERIFGIVALEDEHSTE